jgi:hypothetical protein
MTDEVEVKDKLDQDISIIIQKREDPRVIELLKSINDNLIVISTLVRPTGVPS